MVTQHYKDVCRHTTADTSILKVRQCAMTTLINIPLDLKELHHELRTPLTGLGVIAILRQDKTLTSKQQDELLEMAEQCVQRLLNTVTQVLNSPTKKIKSYNPQSFL